MTVAHPLWQCSPRSPLRTQTEREMFIIGQSPPVRTGEAQVLSGFSSHPDFRLPGGSIQVTLGAVHVCLAVVALQPVLLGGLKSREPT